MKQRNIATRMIASGLILSAVMIAGCQQPSSSAGAASNTDSLKNIVLQLAATNDSIASRLTKFDDLDFNVFSNQ